MKKMKTITKKLLTGVKVEYITRDRSISVITDNSTGATTIEVTLFVPVADRVFDNLNEDKRRAWVNEFFNGVGAPRIREYTLIKKGY